jgi:hypothetical protein
MLRAGERTMIVEMRTYTLAMGATGRYFKLYGEKGLAVQKRILGHLVGYYGVEVGGLNKVIHLWAYDNLDERAKRARRCGPTRSGWPMWPRSAASSWPRRTRS